MKSFAHRIVEVCGLALALAWVGAGGARAATVTLEPPDSTVTVNGEFTVRAVIDAVADLKTFQLIYRYDPARLELLDVDPGDILTSSASWFEARLLDHVSPPDSLWYDAAVLEGTGTGPGVLAFIRFRAIDLGDAHLECLRIDLRDSQNHQTLPPCSDAVIHVVGATPVQPTSWGRIKSRYR